MKALIKKMNSTLLEITLIIETLLMFLPHDMKQNFDKALTEFVKGLNNYVSTQDGQWTIKGFIDSCRNVYTISSDTKIISKILEIHP